jgi:hypothetical protein
VIPPWIVRVKRRGAFGRVSSSAPFDPLYVHFTAAKGMVKHFFIIVTKFDKSRRGAFWRRYASEVDGSARTNRGA